MKDVVYAVLRAAVIVFGLAWLASCAPAPAPGPMTRGEPVAAPWGWRELCRRDPDAEVCRGE